MHQSLRVLMLGDWVALDGSPCHKAFRKLRYLSVGDITAFPFKDLSKLDNLKIFLNRSKPGMNLSHLPSSLKRISHEVPNVGCNKFRELPLQNLNSLKSFIVNTDELKSVELPKELHLPTSLVELNLKGCKTLPKDIGHLTALESLILHRIKLDYPPEGFSKIQKLKHLSINYCSTWDFCSKVSFLVEELGNFSSLEALSIEDANCELSLSKEGGNLTSSQESLLMLSMQLNRWRKLKALPESLGKLRIHKLKLQLYSLQELPSSFGNMPLLKDLSFYSCHSLMSLPDSFGSLPSLEALSIKHCKNLKALPESLGKLRIHKLKLDSLDGLQELPNSFGNLPLLKDLRLFSCPSLMSVPDSFVELRMLETLKIEIFNELSILPEHFGRLRYLKHMTLEYCDLLEELPRGFGALPALKTFKLMYCNRIQIFSRDFTELSSLEELHLKHLDLISRIPDGFGKLKRLRYLVLEECPQLKTLSDDFENLATLEKLRIRRCPQLEGAMMEKILKLQNCSIADIEGSTKLSEKWKQMHNEIEQPITVFSGDQQIDRDVEKRAIMEALLNGKCVEVDHSSRQLMERSSLLVGFEEGTSVTVAFIILPIKMDEYDHQIVQRFVEMARKTAKTNGWGMLQIVCARRYVFWIEEKIKEEDDICQILLSLQKGSCALSERVKILSEYYYGYGLQLKFCIGHVMVDMEGRKSFESFEEHEDLDVNEVEDEDGDEDEDEDEDEVANAEADEVVLIEKFIDSLFPYNRSKSSCVEVESKTKEFIQALKSNGIHHLEIEGRQIRVDDLHGKTIGFIICEVSMLEWIKLTLAFKDLQPDSNFIAILIPARMPFCCGHGGYTRLSQGLMRCATIPIRIQLYMSYPRFVVVDNEGQIANQNAWGLLSGWGLKFHPFTQHSILESFFKMESKSLLECFFHEMNIKPMKGKITFLYAARASEWLEMKCELEQFTQIHSDFEVLYVGKLRIYDISTGDANIAKQEYEDATQNMRWPSLSVSDWIRFWCRCSYFASHEYCNLYSVSNKMMKTVHFLASQLCKGDGPKLVLVDSDEVVTFAGERVLEMICGPCDGISNGEGMDELIARLSRGGCSVLQFLKTWFGDEIDNHPQHPQHHLHRFIDDDENSCFISCYVCFCRHDYFKWSYGCKKCGWQICGRCWMACAKQQAEQLLRGKRKVEVELPARRR